MTDDNSTVVAERRARRDGAYNVNARAVDGFTGGVMVAVDGRPGSVAAARWGAAVASLAGLKLELVRVLPNTAELLPANEEWYIEQIRKKLKAWVKRHHLGECTMHVVVADPADELVRHANDRTPSMVVIGTPGRTRTGKGRVALAQHLARLIAQPVVVVPDRDIDVAGRPVVAGVVPFGGGMVLDWARSFASYTGGNRLGRQFGSGPRFYDQPSSARI